MKAFLRIVSPEEIKRETLVDVYKTLLGIFPKDSIELYNGHKMVLNKVDDGFVYSIPMKDHLGLEEAEFIVTNINDMFGGDFVIQTSVDDSLVDGSEIDSEVGELENSLEVGEE